MIPPLLLQLPAVASGIGLPLMDVLQPPDLMTAIVQFAGQFATGTGAVLSSLNLAVVDIARVAYLTCLLIGVLLYFTPVGRRLGKDLMLGGVLLVVVSEYLVPAVSAISK
jgi:hypothetical protein